MAVANKSDNLIIKRLFGIADNRLSTPNAHDDAIEH